MAKKKNNKKNTPATIKPEALITIAESAKKDLGAFTGNKVFLENPSRVLKSTKEGNRLGLELFEEMEGDDQISSELTIRRAKVKSAPFTITCHGGNDKDQEQADELKKRYEPFHRELLGELLDSQMMGFAVVELFWEIIDGRYSLTKTQGHDQKKFTFTAEGELVLNTDSGKQLPVERQRVAIATFRQRKGNPFGWSLGNQLFFPWFFKKHDWLFWSNWIEKFAQPTVIGRYPHGTDKKARTKLLNACQAVQNDMAVILEREWDIALMEAKRGGSTDAYKDFYRACNMAISKVINLTTLHSNESEYGSRAQSTVHETISDFAPEDDCIWLSNVITRDVIRPWGAADYSFSVPPSLSINYLDEDTGKEAAETDKILNEFLPLSVDELYDKYKRRKPDEKELVTFGGAVKAYEELQKGGNVDDTDAAAEFAEGEDEPVIEENELIILEEGDYISALFEANKDDIANASKSAIDELQGKLGKVDDYGEAINVLWGYRSGAEGKWEQFLAIAMYLGESAVRDQIELLSAKQDVSNFAEYSIDTEKFRILQPTEAIEWFERRLNVKKGIYELLGPRLKDSAFYVSDLEDLNKINKIKKSMIKALKEGKAYKVWYKELFMDSSDMLLFSNMKTAFHNNMFAALAYQNEVALQRSTDRFPFHRYSCVLDGKSRISHAAQHGVVARHDDPYWTIWTPPNGHFCRCRKLIAMPGQMEEGQRKFKSLNGVFKPDKGFKKHPMDNQYPLLKRMKQGYGMKLNQMIRSLKNKDLDEFKRLEEELKNA